MRHVELRREIELSWRRSSLSGVPRGDGSSDSCAHTPPRTRETSLARAARPVLQSLHDDVRDADLALLLGDDDGHILTPPTSGARVQTALEQRGILQGSCYNEATAGTNGIGTPLESQRPVQINGEEHFSETLKAFSCYGEPIVHPITRHVVGVLDITGYGPRVHPLYRPVVNRAVAAIEKRLGDQAGPEAWRLLTAFQQSCRRHGPVVALGSDVWMDNSAARELLDSHDYALLRELGTDLTGPGATRTELASGRRVLLEMSPVAGTSGAVVFRLLPDRRAGTAPGGASAPRAASVTADPVGADTITGVVGEPGSGRTTRALQLAGAQPPDPAGADGSAARRGEDSPAVTVVTAAQVDEIGAIAWLRALTRALRSPGRTVVVDDIDQLSPDLFRQVGRRLSSPLPTGTRLIVTASTTSEHDDPLVGELLTRCRRIAVAPLRERRAEIPEIVRALAAQIGPDTAIRLSPSLLTMLAACPWPGNLAELRAVLGRVLDDCRGEVALPEHLPDKYRLSAKVARLGELDRAQRDAIVVALAATGGNKSDAAKRLGISRTTLYSRIRQLDIR